MKRSEKETEQYSLANRFPVENEAAQKGPDQNTNDKISVVVHGQQHHEIADAKLQDIQNRPHNLLPRAGAKSRYFGSDGLYLVGEIGVDLVVLLVVVVGAVLSDQKAVVLFGGAAEHFEGDDQQHNADAGAGKDAAGGDLPGLGDEAGVDGVPVPEHLRR